MKFLVSGFLFFSLLPFISPLPVESDVQLPAFVFGAAIILLDILRGRFRFDWIDLAFLMMAVWSFAYVLPGGEFVLRQRVGLMLAFIIFWVAKRHAPQFSPWVVYVAIVVNFVAVMIAMAVAGCVSAGRSAGRADAEDPGIRTRLRWSFCRAELPGGNGGRAGAAAVLLLQNGTRERQAADRGLGACVRRPDVEPVGHRLCVPARRLRNLLRVLVLPRSQTVHVVRVRHARPGGGGADHRAARHDQRRRGGGRSLRESRRR